MSRHPPHLIELSRADRQEPESLLRDGRPEQRVARRACLLLAMTDPETVVEQLAERVALTNPFCHLGSTLRRAASRPYMMLARRADRGRFPRLEPQRKLHRRKMLGSCLPDQHGLAPSFSSLIRHPPI